MVVTADRLFGTIGGGNLEHQATEEARELLTTPQATPSRRDYALTPKLFQCCGGAVSLILEPFFPVNKVLYLFGAGHVGRSLVQVLDGLPIKIKWIDEREHEFPALVPANCEKVVTATPAEQLKAAPEGCYILVMTHLHPQDYKIVRAAFKQDQFAYLGLIGSKTKRSRFEKHLQEAGVPKNSLQRLTCPIGIEGITGKHPREIAVAVAAQLLQIGMTRADLPEQLYSKQYSSDQ
jgi:xanthine dehydrogenase accessory factor